MRGSWPEKMGDNHIVIEQCGRLNFKKVTKLLSLSSYRTQSRPNSTSTAESTSRFTIIGEFYVVEVISVAKVNEATSKSQQVFDLQQYYPWAKHRPTPIVRPLRISHPISLFLPPYFGQWYSYMYIVPSMCFYDENFIACWGKKMGVCHTIPTVP